MKRKTMLTNKQRAEVLALRLSDKKHWSYERLAEKFGCSTSTCWEVCNRDKVGPRQTRKIVTHTRQNILNYINAHPGCLSTELAAHFSQYSDKSIWRHVREMAQVGEVRRDGFIYGSSKGFRITGLTKVASKAIRIAGVPESANDKWASEDVLDDVTTVLGSRTSHLGSQRKHPVKCSGGGQGAVRQRVYVGASAGML